MTPAQTNARRTLWLLAGVGAVLVFVMLRPFAEAMVAGTLFAVAFHAPHLKIRSLIRSANWSAAVSTLLLVLLFIAPLGIIIPILIREFRESVALLNSSDTIFERIASYTGLEVEELKKTIAARLQQAGESLFKQGVTVIGVATGGIIQTLVAIGTFFFAVRDGQKLYRETLAISPLGRDRTKSLLLVANEMLQASIYGVIAVAVAQGILCGVGVWIAGLPTPLMWGFAAAAVSVIPLIGSALVWVPAVLVLFAKGSTGKAIFMLAWGAGVVSMADNVVRPWILATQVPIHPLLVMVTMLGAAQAFGIIGFVAGPVVLALFLALLRALRDEGEPAATQAE